MLRGDCILVFGVPGVGKTAACEAFVRRHPEFLYFRASRLLSEATKAELEQLRIAHASEIEANQDLIAMQLEINRDGRWGQPVLVDGHGVIDNDSELVRVPVESVRSMKPDGIILLEAPPGIVAARRRKDVRTRPERTIAEIAREIEAERQSVLDYGRHLAIPIESATASDQFELDASVAALRDKIHDGN